MEHILFSIENNVAKITLNRPKVFNSFTMPMATEMLECLDECQKNEAVRAIYLTGNGKAFCAGQDLEEAVSGPNIRAIVKHTYDPIVKKIRAIEKPFVCAVNGVAAGAGANIALACDIAIASANASFIQAFSKIGLIPDSAGTFFLPRIIGMQKATALMMLGSKVSAEEAERIGMIYKVVDHESFEEEAMKVATRLASMPTVGLGLTKRLLNHSFTNSLHEQLAMEEELQYVAAESEDHKEGIRAFLEKRKPVFTGK